MTFAEILSREENNWDAIYLYREGIFLKAYEHSAFMVHVYIHEFKLSKRYIKTVNQNVISLGFPEKTIEKWLNGKRYVYVDEGMVKCELGKKCDEVEYQTWKDVAPVNASDRFTPHTHIIEKAPVYKNAYDLLTQVMTFTVHISKNMQTPIGIRLKDCTYQMCYLVRTLYDVHDQSEQISKAQNYCDEILFLLQILKDQREISLNTYALASERTVSVSKQLTSLGVKVKA